MTKEQLDLLREDVNELLDRGETRIYNTLTDAVIIISHIDEQQRKIDRLRESLRWYEKIVGECSRRDHEGVLAKNALVADSGGIAKAALKEARDDE